MNKFEYKEVRLYAYEYVDKLNALGAEGWEVVESRIVLSRHESKERKYLLKRELADVEVVMDDIPLDEVMENLRVVARMGADRKAHRDRMFDDRRRQSLTTAPRATPGKGLGGHL